MQKTSICLEKTLIRIHILWWVCCFKQLSYSDIAEEFITKRRERSSYFELKKKLDRNLQANACTPRCLTAFPFHLSSEVASWLDFDSMTKVTIPCSRGTFDLVVILNSSKKINADSIWRTARSNRNTCSTLKKKISAPCRWGLCEPVATLIALCTR